MRHTAVRMRVQRSRTAQADSLCAHQLRFAAYGGFLLLDEAGEAVAVQTLGASTSCALSFGIRATMECGAHRARQATHEPHREFTAR